MERFGGDGPPQSQPFLLDDYGTGVRAAFGMGLALYHRVRTGRGQHIRTALVETASYHAARHLVSYEGKQWNEPRGQQALGEGPLQRLYRASDAWFFLGATDAQRTALAAVEGLDGTANLQGTALERALEERFAREPVATWLERLQAAGMGASGLGRMRDLMVDPWAEAHGLVVTQDVEGVGRVRMPGAAPRLSGTPVRIGDPVRPPGADGPFVLGRIGLGDAVDRLAATGAIKVPAAEVV
jgi:crotonobetainyl-CoA:carnitine CoA-transferase CaiB-like acyl-CoA transferase